MLQSSGWGMPVVGTVLLNIFKLGVDNLLLCLKCFFDHHLALACNVYFVYLI